MNETKTVKSSQNYLWIKISIALILLLGVLWRIIQYFGDISFWMDELFSIVNIEKMTMMELLTQQPEYNQVAPPGYYFIQKSILLLAGHSNEMLLRLYPLLCSVVALFLIYKIAARYLKGIELIASIAIVVTALGSWFYGTSAKPYATEQMFMAFFVLVLLILQERELKLWQYILIAIIGFIGTVSTFLGTAFMVGAIPLMFWFGRQKNSVKSLGFVAFLWLLGAFLNVLYTQTVLDQKVTSDMADVHSGGFPSGGILEYPMWLWNTLSESFDYFMSIDLPIPFFLQILTPIIFFLALPGLYQFFKRDFSKWLILVLPLIMVIALGTLHILPLNNRFGTAVFWILPILAMGGLVFIMEKVNFIRPWMIHTIAIILALPKLLLLCAGLFGLPADFDPTEKLLAQVKADRKAGQLILVHPRAYLQMEYYAPKAGIEDYYILQKEVTPELVEAKLADLDADEVWLVVANILEYPSEVTVEQYDEIFGGVADIVQEHRLSEDTYAILYKFR